MHLMYYWKSCIVMKWWASEILQGFSEPEHSSAMSSIVIVAAVYRKRVSSLHEHASFDLRCL